MELFRCPVCGGALNRVERSLICEKRHSYDLARQGYVNLLMSGQSGAKRHGDDKAMVQARQAFLEKGYYQPLADALLRAVMAHSRENMAVLDAGCGECWYTAQVREALEQKGIAATVAGIDISKDALIAGGKRDQKLLLAVASAYRLPVGDASCDVVLNVFSPCASEEFARVLKSDGVLIRAVPLEKHLWSLKKAVYDVPYENPPEAEDVEGFCKIGEEFLRYRIQLEDTDTVRNLFRMTPYYYKTGEKDQQKIEKLSFLETEIEFGVLIYRKK